MVSRSLAYLCRFLCAGGKGCYFLFAIVHQRSVAIRVCSFIKAAAIPASLDLLMLLLMLDPL